MGVDAIDDRFPIPWRREDLQELGGFNATLLELVKVAALEQRIPFVDGSVIRRAQHLPNGVWFLVQPGVKESLYQLKIVQRASDGEWVVWLSTALEWERSEFR